MQVGVRSWSIGWGTGECEEHDVASLCGGWRVGVVDVEGLFSFWQTPLRNQDTPSIITQSSSILSGSHSKRRRCAVFVL